MANDTAKTLTIGGVTYPIEDEIARQTLLNIVSQVGSLQNALDAMTSSDTTTAIETFQEVIDFLSGVTDSDTLVGKLNELRTLINGKVTAETGKGLSSNDYTTAEKTKLAGIAAGADVNVQSDWNQTNSSTDDFIKNKPVLSGVATSGSYNDLNDKPTIPTALSGLSEDSTHRTVTDAEKATWGGKQDALTFDNAPTANSNNMVNSGGIATALANKANNATIIEVSGDGSVTQELSANTFYKFTGALTSLSLTLASGTGLCVYAGKFTSSSSSACTLSLPAVVSEGANNPDIEAGKTYEFNIVDNILLMTVV